MTHHVHTSWFEGEEWRSYPPPGEVLETNDIHAGDLVRQGVAVPVAEERPAVETRGGARPAAKK
jgi:hypothetical protein